MQNQYDLSILIPARNEMFLANTVENLLQNIRGKTEIIVVLDGAWADPGVPDHKDVNVVYLPEAIGQRAATNLACRLSKAKYVMKIDAHCAVDEGFDVKLLEDIKPNETVVPALYNLHAFDWVCAKCGNRWYQSPSPAHCYIDGEAKVKNDKCDSTEFYRDVIFKPRLNRKSLYFRFDTTLHFQYWGDYGKRPEAQGDIVEILSIQGSCFMLSREKYWELNICDEAHGSWGQQGVEVACKTWLSGGRLVVNKRTWYAHMFRTQGGDFGFPYPLSGADVEKAREYSRNLWMKNTWPLAIHTLDWLLEKFKPVPGWHSEEPNKVKEKKLTKSILFYTDSQLDPSIAKSVQNQLLKAKMPIVSVSLKPLDFGKNIHHKGERGYLTMARQILEGLEASDADIIYFAEHDVLYHPSHFHFTPERKDAYYYNTNIWRVRAADGHALWCDDLRQLSGLVAYRETLLKHFREKVKRLEERQNLSEHEFGDYVRAMSFEPGTHGRPERVDDLKAENYQAEYPNIDIRHDSNLTPSRWNKDQFRNERYTKGWKEQNTVSPWNWPEGKFLDFLATL